MKRILTIAFLGLLLFNWCGYQILNTWLEGRATCRLQSELDVNKYEVSSLISIKVPATHLSYYNNSERFECIQGQIEIGGFEYNFVKRRLYNDSIEMLCIPNPDATHFRRANYDYFKLVYDLQKPGGKKTGAHSFRRFTSVYCTVKDLYHIENIFSGLEPIMPHYKMSLPSNAIFRDERPPERIS